MGCQGLLPFGLWLLILLLLLFSSFGVAIRTFVYIWL